MAEKENGEDNREELPRRADCRADERIEAGDRKVDKVLARGGCQGQAQHVALPGKKCGIIWEREQSKTRQSGQDGGEQYVGSSFIWLEGREDVGARLER